jgi:hypothetical protein
MPSPPSFTQAHASVRSVIRPGLIVGAALSGVAITWLLAANRVPALDRLALLRNLVAGALAVVFMLVPVFRFRNHPSHLLSCGITAWSVLTLTYAILQIPFPRLGIRMGTFHFFMLGAVVLGLASALLWVVHLILGLRHQTTLTAHKRVR